MFRKTFKKPVWWLVIAAVMVIVGITSYYTREVIQARADTPHIMQEALASDRLILSPEDLSDEQLNTLLAVKDPHFFTHNGWDFAGGTMTTITQVLTKWYYFDNFQQGLPKIRQSLIARFALDPFLSKEDQLRLFINNIWLAEVDGKPVVGFAEGAHVFYGKAFSELTFDEYLSLLMFDQPATLNRHVNPEGNARRVSQIKRLLAGECQLPGLLNLPPNCWTEDPG